MLILPDALHQLNELLTHLSGSMPAAAYDWKGWQIVPVLGGMNNRLYRATTEHADLAIKWTLPDERDRAGREYAALAALTSLGLDLAPAPVLLNRTSYALPVVVQTWLPGEPLSAPPRTDAAWAALLAHYASIHQVTPERLTSWLPDAVLAANSIDAARELVWRQVRQLPEEACPALLQQLVARLDAWRAPRWPTPPRTLLRSDPNVRNVVRRSQDVASVDWENSGWGDPAFEIADLTTHPAYLDVSEDRWAWVARTYASLSGDPRIGDRLHGYRVCLLVWWVARLARTLHEAPRGRDERLVARPPDWSADVMAKLDRYAALADAALREVDA